MESLLGRVQWSQEWAEAWMPRGGPEQGLADEGASPDGTETEWDELVLDFNVYARSATERLDKSPVIFAHGPNRRPFLRMIERVASRGQIGAVLQGFSSERRGKCCGREPVGPADVPASQPVHPGLQLRAFGGCVPQGVDGEAFQAKTPLAAMGYQGRKEPVNVLKEPGCTPQRVVSAVRVIQRDDEPLQTMLLEVEYPFRIQQEAVADQCHVQPLSLAVPDDLVKVGVEEGFAAQKADMGQPPENSGCQECAPILTGVFWLVVLPPVWSQVA